MESLSQVFTPQLVAIQNQYWGWADGWSDGMLSNAHVNNFTASVAGSSKSVVEDFSRALPDELLEKIIASLPIISIFRAGAVCRRWNALTTSRRFFSLCKQRTSGPWYFMYKESQNTEGLVYDPLAKKWHDFTLPLRETSSWFAASSNGLVCFADNSYGYVLYVCNLMTKTWTKIPEPHQQWSSDYYAVSMTLDRASKVQSAVVARSSQLPNDYLRWSFRIEACNSLSQIWKTHINTILHGWRGGENSVICNGIFYCVIHSTAMVGSRNDECRLGLLSYELASGNLEVGTMPMPSPLTCVKLINCNERLIMVGGIGKSDVVRGIGIWELEIEWREISRMPNKFFRGFGEFDDVFSSSGADDLIYIHAYGSPQLLLFNIQQHSWRWSQKCPMVKKHPLHLFTGFCFEPCLDVSPWSN